MQTMCDSGGAAVDSALFVEGAARPGAERNVQDTADHPEDAKHKAPVADKAKDKKAVDKVDDATAKRRDHARKEREHNRRLELHTEEEERDDQQVCREHPDREVGRRRAEVHTPLGTVLQRVRERVRVRRDQRHDPVDKKKPAKHHREDRQRHPENALPLALLPSNTPLFYKHVRCCSWHPFAVVFFFLHKNNAQKQSVTQSQKSVFFSFSISLSIQNHKQGFFVLFCCFIAFMNKTVHILLCFTFRAFIPFLSYNVSIQHKNNEIPKHCVFINHHLQKKLPEHFFSDSFCVFVSNSFWSD